jgi:hypothetical protein
LGDEDTNDNVPYEADIRAIFYRFGDTPVKRWQIAEKMYQSAACSSQFVLHPGAEHSISAEMEEGIKTFFLENLKPR